MGNYYKLKGKASMVVRPVLPKDFILTAGVLAWDDTDAVYSLGVIEQSKDNKVWERLCTFLPDEGKAEAGKLTYRMRVSYNQHWSTYLQAEKAKVKEEPKVEEDPKLRVSDYYMEDYKRRNKRKK